MRARHRLLRAPLRELLCELLPALLLWLSSALVMQSVEASEPVVINEAQAIVIAQRVVTGRVLSVQLIRGGNGMMYRVKILTADGRVRTINIDADSGNVLNA